MSDKPLFGGKGAKNSTLMRNNNVWAPQGTNYTKRFGSRSNTLASALDTQSFNEKRKQMATNYGDGATMMRFYEGDGVTPKSNAPINIGGKTFYTNNEGGIRVLDQDLLDEVQQINKEREDYIDSVMEQVLANNQIAEFVLGGAYDLLAPGSAPDFMKSGGDVYKPMVDANGTPDFLKYLDSNSIAYGCGMAKLRAVVSEHLPARQHMTSDAVADHNV